MLKGHNGWVTSIASGFSQKENEDSDVLVTGGRDNKIILWSLYGENIDGLYGVPFK